MCPECSLHVGYTILLLQSLLHVCMADMASAWDPWSLAWCSPRDDRSPRHRVAMARSQLLASTSLYFPKDLPDAADIPRWTASSIW